MKHISSVKDAYECINPFYNEKDTTVEHCAIILLNAAFRAVAVEFVAMGSEKACVIPIKVIAKKAILSLASGVVLVHNHPSGSPEPSKEDIKMTEQLRDTLNVFDTSLVDHIILGDNCYFSFSEGKTFQL